MNALKHQSLPLRPQLKNLKKRDDIMFEGSVVVYWVVIMQVYCLCVPRLPRARVVSLFLRLHPRWVAIGSVIGRHVVTCRVPRVQLTRTQATYFYDSLDVYCGDSLLARTETGKTSALTIRLDPVLHLSSFIIPSRLSSDCVGVCEAHTPDKVKWFSLSSILLSTFSRVPCTDRLEMVQSSDGTVDYLVLISMCILQPHNECIISSISSRHLLVIIFRMI